MHIADSELRGDNLPDDSVRQSSYYFVDFGYFNSMQSNRLLTNRRFLQAAELHLYADFLRLVLEILNAILTYALPRNPEV